tara:strand:+ start:10384 stop:10509 length:126 start_codon:yes stop_codon:yes gene_type:complete
VEVFPVAKQAGQGYGTGGLYDDLHAFPNELHGFQDVTVFPV